MFDGSGTKDFYEPAIKSAVRKKTAAQVATGPGLAGMAVGLAVPAAAVAAPFGLVVVIYAGLFVKSASREIQ
ncbi:hypothetical protein DYH09_17220 [bacterium CPR1]|nr:hypothetical protein [bacterium CPR1]